MRFLVILATGAALCLFLFLNGLPVYGMTAIVGTFILFFASAAVKKKLIMRNPRMREALERKRRSLERKLGVDSYNIRLEKTSIADAVIIKIADTGERFNDNPRLVFQLEVRPAFGSAFLLEVEKTIPYILLPQFQPGKVFTINYDPSEPVLMGFLNYRTNEGAIIDLADYPI